MIKGVCSQCKQKRVIHIHHKDGNHSNDDYRNVATLCVPCHQLAHSKMRGEGERLPVDWKPPAIGMDVIREQYRACFPRT